MINEDPFVQYVQYVQWSEVKCIEHTGWWEAKNV